MHYKYQKRQIFRKRLEVPKIVRSKIYSSLLSFEEFMNYGLEDKIPLSCLAEQDRKIVEKFGIERAKTLDWELLNNHRFVYKFNVKEMVMKLDSSTEDLNFVLYELVKNQIQPRNYTSRMKEIYADRLFSDISNEEDYDLQYRKLLFNDGRVSLLSLISNWDLYKEKDLSYCLQMDEKNQRQITDGELKTFMNDFGSIASLMEDYTDLYEFIYTTNHMKDDSGKKEYIQKVTDAILSDTIQENVYQGVQLSNQAYKQLFKYSSLEDYLKKADSYQTYHIDKICKEIKKLPEEYLFHSPIPFDVFKHSDVLTFVGVYGLKNIVDFDNENSHFFTENHCQMLKLMNDMYLHYGGTVQDPNRTIYTKNWHDENGNYIDRPYTKDEFYEAMRRMIVYGPTDWNYADKAPDYRKMTGEFRIRNSELFISDNAPEDLKHLFYTKSITPSLILQHPEYVEYLNGKDLAYCFHERQIQVERSDSLCGYENIYKFLSSKTDFNGVMDFITEYSDVLDIVFDRKWVDSFQHEIKFSINDDINQISTRINELLKKFIIEKELSYPVHIPKKFIETYPTMFLSQNAPKELQEAFYNRMISPDFLLLHPEYHAYLKDVDLDVLYPFMPVRVIYDDGEIGRLNLPYIIQQVYGREEGHAVMSAYGKYMTTVSGLAHFLDFELRKEFLKEDLLKEMDTSIWQKILTGQMKYNENAHIHFKENYATLFLAPTVSEEIREKFYNRKFTLNDFWSNPSLLDVFGSTNVICGLNEEVAWMIPLFEKQGDNRARLKAVNAYLSVKDSDFQGAFKRYLKARFETIDIATIVRLSEGLKCLLNSEKWNAYIGEAQGNENLYRELAAVCGYSNDVSCLLNLFSSRGDSSYLDMLKFISLYKNIQDGKMRTVFKEFVINFKDDIDTRKIEYIVEVLNRLSLSNSSEIHTFKDVLASQILKTSNPMESLKKIEDIFIKNNIPTVGKIYSCFDILHPDFAGFDFNFSTISPVLKKASTMGKKSIVFSDLIKASFGSNNRSVNAYLKNIEIGSSLYERIKNGQIQYDELNDLYKNELTIFSMHLSTLYHNTLKGKNEERAFTLTGDVLKDITNLSQKLSPDGTLDYNLGDRVIRMFCGFAGIHTLEEAKVYIHKTVKEADTRNRETAKMEVTLNQGDFVKGIGDVTYLRNILQNGSVSREYLGSCAGSDFTPLDTDVSIIQSTERTLNATIDQTASSGYGPIYFVLKGDDRFIVTRTVDGTQNVKNDMFKLEAFYTGAVGESHYGIRTGFASSDINYVLMEAYDKRVGLEIAMNGFYIPVANMKGELVFTPEEYDKLREKMQGLSYYDENDYVFSENLVTEDTEYLASQIEQNNYEVGQKREKIVSVIERSLRELNLQIKTYIDGDLTEGYVELIDTGSTGRGTNQPGDGDFDFMMRLDRAILSDSKKVEHLKKNLLQTLGKENEIEVTGAGDFRLKSVQIDEETCVDIDITFTEKTDKVAYSTDMALQDRLLTIQKLAPEKYNYVISNILVAKKVLKDAGVYKPDRGLIPQGGLGGVGIENWILQNGGSFLDAAKDFVNASQDKSFQEFKEIYQIWDFGDNHLSERRRYYPHDNFVSGNMSESGYNKMVTVLNEYIKKHEYEQENSKNEALNVK